MKKNESYRTSLSKNYIGKDLMTLKEASEWASTYLKRKVGISNISYLVQYGKIKKHETNNSVMVSKNDLLSYYQSFHGKRENNWKNKLGNDLNWTLSFDYLREKDTTKHVHRLHPYKGKFIPQLVEYFLDNHIDDFKKNTFFKKDDIILDPFCGSGTTLVQANELGMHAIGIDISEFNSLISNIKISDYDLSELSIIIHKLSFELQDFIRNTNIKEFEKDLLNELKIFNNKYFPTPDYRYNVSRGKIDEFSYGKLKEEEFLPIYFKLLDTYKVKTKNGKQNDFLDKWYTYTVREQISFIYKSLNEISDNNIKTILTIILSRTIRSCRATTHSDLATLKEPQLTSYYCHKHKKICKPLFSIIDKWKTYSKDTMLRLDRFAKLKTNTHQVCLTGDSRNINIEEEIKQIDEIFYNILVNKKVSGIFSSPPYVGLINYHEQHAYAYDLFKFKRRDDLEIGPLYKGTGKEAQKSYIDGVSSVLLNCKKYLIDDFDVFLVANDKYNLYPSIAEKANMIIVNQYKRPVLNRTERDKAAYSEIIFHLKKRTS